ncbi:MAG: hypothetical protein US77_C0022G0013 [Microgenomates group bacterium GW2011_GWC1_38_14]|uniref:Uncharacterized protein n=1 Tax=Candidatus Giovannonibacteria bacterium GW2011_GWA1_44_25 TaxID=1618645 RepID=A0A0G1IIG1_9BACT|nr:MAG: hypothetical protein US77_C0022G0013 [Microgenomates group bacterium GW2011_GWC1_38_14]KKT58980.1 MAG: hypothetical protein UW53_C0027G0010 [Candidatus Giovannonibacteria bacterium GW2011_GWA1_44_25]OGH44788.1 MAG: hypothetical protein A3I49_00930 [Candidatus Levybacteria bacterium RIFCSPLOWO2_02_FULL_37_11]
MKKAFYSHLIDTSSISLALGDMELTQEERIHLISLVESSLHHAVLDMILSELNEGDREEFVKQLADEDDEKIWNFLNKKIDNIEKKIRNTAEELKKELHKDIKES